jgi:hypothetical protein
LSEPDLRSAASNTDSWTAGALVEATAEGLAQEAAARDAAQETMGVDSLLELALHPPVAAGLSKAGYGVWPEQRYPVDRRDSRRNRGRRCDMVLTPGGRPLSRLEGLNGHARLPFPQQTHLCREDASVVSLAEAFWLEIKSVAQHDAGGPAADYCSGLFTEWAADVRKISSDPGLVYAGLLLIAFTADAATARHDRDLWRLCCLKDDLPLLSPATAGFTISDRLGNSHCSLALFPILAARA